MKSLRTLAAALAVAIIATAAAQDRKPPTPHRMTMRTNFPMPPFPKDNPLTVEGVALGRRLFSEGRLSRDGSISCLNCHQPDSAMSDFRTFSVGVGGAIGRRHSMPLVNLVWRRGFFWDGRAKSLREQIVHPIEDPKEMATTLGEATERLRADPLYVEEFTAAFPDDGLTTSTVTLALEQFLLTIISQNSRFDRAARGEVVLTDQEKRGAELFFLEYDPGRGTKGADCFHCHPLPLLTNERFANNGLGEDRTDHGRAEVTKKDYDIGRFKVPSLRNVAETAPYMHDGRFDTLAEVIDHYDHGVVRVPNLDPALSKHDGPLNLSPEDKAALIAFLRSLTDEEFMAAARAGAFDAPASAE